MKSQRGPVSAVCRKAVSERNGFFDPVMFLSRKHLTCYLYYNKRKLLWQFFFYLIIIKA